MKINRLVFLLIFGLFLYGDVMYEMLTTTQGMMGMGDSETMMRIFIKGDRSRTEIISKSASLGEFTNIYIVRLDKRVVWTFDDSNKKYTEVTLEANLNAEPEKPLDSMAAKPQIKVEATGEKKKLLENDCEKVIVLLKLDTKETDFDLTQTMWVAKDLQGSEEIIAYNKKLTEIGGGMMQAAQLGIDKKSLQGFMNKINEINGFPLELELDMEINFEEIAMTTTTKSQVTKISVVPISDKVFEIPEGYSPQ